MEWAKAIGAFFQAVFAGIGLASKRSDLKNAPDVKAAKVSAEEQKELDRITNNVKKRDLDAIRKDAAE